MSNPSNQNSKSGKDLEEISKLISTKICSPEVLKLLDEALQNISETEAAQATRRKLVETILKALRGAKVSISHVDEIINRLSIDFPKYSKEQLVKLVEFCVTSISDDDDPYRCWKDLLPILLELLEEEKYVCHMNQEVSGSEYKSLIIQSICNNKWNPEILPPLAKMFGDMSLGKAECDKVIRILCYKLPEISLSEIPPFVHQALKLCSNHDIKYLLETLRRYFASRYTDATSTESDDVFENIGAVSFREVQDTESTVLYYIYQAAQLNYKSMTDFVRSLKNTYYATEYILEPFMLSVLLLLSNMYEDQIFDTLKLCIHRQLEDNEKRKCSAWLRELLPNVESVEIVMNKVIEHSDKDRHFILKALVEFTFVLLNTEQKKNNENSLCHVGSSILHTLVKKHHETGGRILELLIYKIVAGGTSIQQYTECLAYICRKSTMTVLGSQTLITTLLDQLLSIPGEAGENVLYAILPLIRISPNVRDNLILILRKVLYRNGTYKRQMAVIGFLEILRGLKAQSLNLSRLSQPDSSSTHVSSATSLLTQVTLEQDVPQIGSSSEQNKNLCYDILSILKKCFTHEHDVRSKLYEGLYDVVWTNRDVAELVLEMLFTHFNAYFDEDENVLPPLRFDLCSDIQGTDAILQEPIADLICAIEKIYIKMASKDLIILDKIADILESLCRRMIQLEIEHFNVDDGTDLLDGTPKSQQKLENLKLTVKVYETLMAFRILVWSQETRDSAQSILSLFKGYKRFMEFIKRISKPRKGNKNKKDQDVTKNSNKKVNRAISKLPNTAMDLEAVYKILSLFYLPSVPWSTKEQTTSLKVHQDFFHYILQSCIQLLQNVKSMSDTTLMKHKQRYMKLYIEIGVLLYKYPIKNLKDLFDTDQKTAQLVLECYKEICFLMCDTFSSQLPNFLRAACEKDNIVDFNMQLETMIHLLKSHLKASLLQEADDNSFSQKVPMALMEIIDKFVQKINFETIMSEKISKWMKKLATLENINTPLALMILNVLLKVEEHTREYGEILSDICVELCAKLGTVDKVDVTTSEVFQIIQNDAALQAYNIVNNYVKEKLGNAVWLLTRLKAEQVVAVLCRSNDETHHDNLKEKERSLCRQLSHIIQILQNLTNTAVDPGQSTDTIFKNLHNLYNLLSSLTKYFHGKSTAQNPAFQSAKFIQVVQTAGKPLKSAFYNLVTHTEENQNKKTNAKSDMYAQRNKILRETRVIPRVVYEIEQFNKEIILLGKKTGVPLESYIKHSVTRDFRIKNSQLVEGLEKMDVSMLNTQNTPAPTNTEVLDTSTGNESEEMPSRKRMRTS